MTVKNKPKPFHSGKVKRKPSKNRAVTVPNKVSFLAVGLVLGFVVLFAIVGSFTKQRSPGKESGNAPAAGAGEPRGTPTKGWSYDPTTADVYDVTSPTPDWSRLVPGKDYVKDQYIVGLKNDSYYVVTITGGESVEEAVTKMNRDPHIQFQCAHPNYYYHMEYQKGE